MRVMTEATALRANLSMIDKRIGALTKTQPKERASGDNPARAVQNECRTDDTKFRSEVGLTTAPHLPRLFLITDFIGNGRLRPLRDLPGHADRRVDQEAAIHSGSSPAQASSSRSTFASLRSGVPKPSVNQP
jgi:hypothetical protein